MGAYSVGSIATNTSEDYIDELTSGIVYKYADFVLDGFDETKIKDDDAFAEALEGAKQTLKFSIMNAVIITVTEYAIGRLIVISGLIYTYIKGSSAVGKVKRKASNLFGTLGKKGGFLFKPLKLLGDIALGSQEERLKMAGMANDTANSVTGIIAIERQTQSLMTSKKHENITNVLGLNSKTRFSRDQKKLEAYHYKMKTGTWQNTPIDKNLFLSCVPKEYITQPFNFSSSFVEKLNSFKEYANDSEGKLVNLAQTHLDLITNNGLSKVQ